MKDHSIRYMTVVKINKDQSHSLDCIDLYEVDYIESDKKRRIIFHIGEDVYYQIITKSDFEQYLSSEGFDPLDKPNLVNLRKVRKFDKEYGKVYFEEYPTPSSKYATVARIKYKFIASLLDKVVAHNNDITTEIKADKKGLKNTLKGLIGSQ